jgi:ketosteroid isomerase-like protein
MTNTSFASAEDAQRAFYEAIERADLAGMMAIWSQQDDIVCIHPGGDRHCGAEAVHESWRQIFQRGPQLKFSLVAARSYRQRTLSIHSVCERISHRSGAHGPVSAIATNVFVRTADGWKMLVHHASPMPAERLPEQTSSPVLH